MLENAYQFYKFIRSKLKIKEGWHPYVKDNKFVHVNSMAVIGNISNNVEQYHFQVWGEVPFAQTDPGAGGFKPGSYSILLVIIVLDLLCVRAY